MIALSPYPEYLDSGVDWLGHIPVHWDTPRIKRVARLNPSKSELPSLDDDFPVSFVPMEKLGTNGSIDGSSTRPYGDVKSGLTYFREHDVLLAKITPCFENGKSGVARGLKNGFGFGSTEYHVLRADASLDADYLYRVLSSKPVLFLGEEFMEGSAGQKRVPTDFIANLRIPHPPVDEQCAIVDFLNAMDARITRFIAARKKMIRLLEEKKQAVINQVVTKGLKPTVPMKDSSVEWLGDIPEHWKCARIKHVAKLESGHTPSRTDPENWLDSNEIPWVSLNDTKTLAFSDYIDDTKFHINDHGLETSSALMLPAGAVVFTRDATIGKAAITTRPMAVSQHLIAWICGPRLTSEYLLQVFYALEPNLEFYTFGATIRTIGMDDVGKLSTPVPPIDEQVAIVRHVTEQRQECTGLIDRIKRETELVMDYRNRLISDVVTGKLDVRGIDLGELPEFGGIPNPDDSADQVVTAAGYSEEPLEKVLT